MMLPAPSQVTGVDEITRHDGPSVNCSVPDVTVASVVVPSAFAVHVPLTWSEPVTGAVGQAAASPTRVRSSVPLTERHDDVTVHVPTRSPPQAVPSGQSPPPAP